jgi:hypothetical protein
MAPEVGFEPTTNRLTADRSTTELLRSVVGQDTNRDPVRFKINCTGRPWYVAPGRELILFLGHPDGNLQHPGWQSKAGSQPSHLTLG